MVKALVKSRIPQFNKLNDAHEGWLEQSTIVGLLDNGEELGRIICGILQLSGKVTEVNLISVTMPEAETKIMNRESAMQEQDTLLDKQKTQLVWMTNGIGEISHVTPSLLLALNLDSGAWQNQWYPLTSKERLLIKGCCFTMPSGFLAHVGYSAIHDDRKWVVCDVEYTDDTALDDDTENARLWDIAERETAVFRGIIEIIGGKVFLYKDELDYGHVLHIAFPMEEMGKRYDAQQFAYWLMWLVGGKP